MGIAARQSPVGRLASYVTFVVFILAFPALLEFVFISVSGRSFSLVNLSLSVALMLGGMLWINTDRRAIGSAQ